MTFASEVTSFNVNELTATCFGSILRPTTRNGTNNTPPDNPKLPASTPTIAPKIGSVQVGATFLYGM